MEIGICYDLRSWYLERGFTMEETAEFDKEETIAALEGALQALGFQPVRIGNLFQLVEALARGQRWKLVFNISEGLYGPSRETVVPALLDQYRIPYVFSDGETLGTSLNKHLAKTIVSGSGVPVAKGVVVANPIELDQLQLDYPLFVKPLCEGTGKGINDKSKVNDRKSLEEAVGFVLAQSGQPALVEEFLPGREFTVGVVGTGDEARFIGAMEILTSGETVYSMVTKENYERFVQYRKADGCQLEQCSEVALKAWKALGGRDGGRIDLRYDRMGKLCFIEANPLAGLHPVHSDLPMLARMFGIDYVPLIGMIMDSAIKRINLPE